MMVIDKMFSNAFSILLKNRNVTNMSGMFNCCTNLSTIYVEPNWTTDNADTSCMFIYCGTDHVTLKS